MKSRQPQPLLQSLRGRLAIFLLVAFVPLLVGAWHMASKERAAAIAAQLERMQFQASQMVNLHRGFVDDAALILSIVSLEPRVQSSNRTECNAYLASIRNEHSGMDHHLRTYGPDGELRCSSAESVQSLNVRDRPGFRAALETQRVVIGGVITSALLGRPVLPLYLAVRDKAGRVVVVISAAIEVQRFVDHFARETVSRQTRLGLIDGNGKVLARYPDPENLTGQDVSQSPLFRSLNVLRGKGVVSQTGLDGRAIYAAVETLVETTSGPIVLFINRPVEEVRAALDHDYYLTLSGALTLVLLILGLVWFGSERQMLRPLETLTQTAQRLGDGDLSARVPVDRHPDEIGQVGAALNSMADSLGKMEVTVRANRALKVLVAEKRLRFTGNDEVGILTDVCNAVVRVGGYVGAWVGLAQHDAERRLLPVAAAGMPLEFLRQFPLTWGDGEWGDTASAIAIREDRSVLKSNVLDKLESAETRAAVQQMGIRSSLSFPLRVDTRVIGAFTLFGGSAEEFEEQETRLLEELAGDIGRAIEAARERLLRHEAEEALHQSRRQLEEAERVGKIGSWRQVMNQSTVTLSDELTRMLDLGAQAPVQKFEELLKLVHPDDRERVERELANAWWLETPLTIAHRIRLPDGSVRHVTHHVETTSGLEGLETTRLGVVQDVTQLERTQVALRERVKEMRCLYEVFRATEQADQDVPAMLLRVVNLLPQAWFYNEDAVACIRFDGHDYATPRFRESDWMQVAPFNSGETEGVVLVCYLSEQPAAVEGPFLAEERELINAVAGRLQQILQRGTLARKMSQREALHSAMIDQARDSIALIEVPSGRFVEFNRAAYENLGYTAEEFAALHVRDIDAIHSVDEIERVFEHMTANDGDTIETRHRKRSGELIDVRVSARPYSEGGANFHVTFWSDITSIKRSNRQLRAIADATRAIVFAKDEAAMLQSICEALVSAEGYPMAWVGYAEEDEAGSVTPQAAAGTARGYLDVTRITWRGDDPTGRGPSGTAIREGRPVAARHILTDPEFEPWRENAVKYGFAASIAMPLFLDRQAPPGGRAQGAIMFYASEAGAFDEGEVRHLMGLADALSFGIVALRDRQIGKAAEEKVRTVMLRLAHLLSASPVMVYTMKRDGAGWVANEISDNIRSIIGFQPDEAMAPEWWHSGLHPEDRQSANAGLEQAVASGHFVREYRFRHRVGHYVWIRDELKVGRDASGNVSEIVGAWTDVTLSKRAEAEIRKLSAAVEQSPNSVVITDLDANIEYVNDAFVRNSGYTREDVAGRNPRLLQSGRVPCETYAAMWQHLTSGQPWRGEFTNRRKDGSIYIENVAIMPLRGESGAPSHYVAVSEDITERKRAEEELRKLSLAVEQSPSSIAISDLDANLEYVNAAFERHSGYTKAEVIGKNPRVLQSGLTPAEVYTDMWTTLERGDSWKGEFINRRKDGSEYVESAVLVPVRQPDGRTSHYLAIKEDITEAKRMQDELARHRHHLEELVAQRTAELAEARERAEAANQAKSAFLANMSHEIRTPMNAIIGLSHLMQGEALAPAQAERLRKIDASAHNLLDIINDILDLSKIEAGKMVVERVDFDLLKAISVALETLQLRAVEKELILRSEIADDVPRMVSGDPLRLGQILLNLCGNAVKFTEKGSVVLRATVSTRGLHQTRVRFEVIDTGIGLTTDQMARLFAPFEQADASTTRHYGGTGLGLAICKRMTAALGGTIGVESVYGVGSTFWFELPFGAAHAVHQVAVTNSQDSVLSTRVPAGASREPSDTQILLVEDDPINQEVAVEILQRQGFMVSVAANGRVALDLASRQRFDLVLMDVQMPVMDGFAATRELRAAGQHTDTPIVAMTANVFAEDRERCRAAGMDDFVAKPVEPERLLACIAHWTGAILTPQAAMPAASTGGDPSGGLQVRLTQVDDLQIGEGLKSVQGRWTSYERLLRTFVRDHAGDVALMRRFLDERKFADARRVAHTLKGLGGTLGAQSVNQAAASVELAIQTGKDQVAPPKPLVQALDRAVTRLLKGLQKALPPAAAPPATPVPVDAGALRSVYAELEALLAQDDVRAVRLFESNRAMLYAALGDAGGQLEKHIATFEFDRALELLRSAKPA